MYFSKPVEASDYANEMARPLPACPYVTFNPLYSLDRATASQCRSVTYAEQKATSAQSEYEQSATMSSTPTTMRRRSRFSAVSDRNGSPEEMVSHYGDKAYEDGYQRIPTTVTRKGQQAAQDAVRK